MMLPRSARGFTLVELLVTVVIVGLLASMTVPVGELVVKRGKEKDLRYALQSIRNGIDAYKQAVDEGRIKVDKFASGYPPNLRVLVDGVPDMRSPNRDQRIFFLRRIAPDPFAPPSADPVSTWAVRSYASPADAPSEGEDVFDVYSRSRETGLNGIRYQEW
jgi:general secretion pathway protein G